MECLPHNLQKRTTHKCSDFIERIRHIRQKKVNTSTLRHFFESIESQSYQLIEPISENVFGLSNEYFVTFYIDNIIYDKKFVFVPDTIKDENFTNVRIIQQDGVLIK